MLNRRSFLRRTALSAAAFSLPARVHAAAAGANSDVRVAIVGLNGRGRDHLRSFPDFPGVRVTALCDVDAQVLEHAKAAVMKHGPAPRTFTDLRLLLESKEVDVVSFATPNHWHVLGALWALQAGRDVYLEKPVSHNIWEGRQLVKAVAASGRILQVGVQSRSGIGLREAETWARAGHLGAVRWARGLCYKRRPSIGRASGPVPLPAGLDFDLWCGPAPAVLPHRARLHYDWHWAWATGNGDLGNQGAHQMDIARRFLGEEGISPRVFSIGGRMGYQDDGETPNSLLVMHDYKKAPLLFEVRGLPETAGGKTVDHYRGASVGVVVQYEHGSILCPDYASALAFDAEGRQIRRFSVEEKNEETGRDAGEGSEDHYLNFFEAVRTRQPALLRGQVEDGHVSSALCHTGNISYRLGRKQEPEALREAVRGRGEAADSLSRLLAHLEANEVDLSEEQLTLGAFLKFDPAAERFLENAEADRLLTREYRAPFVVPQNV